MPLKYENSILCHDMTASVKKQIVAFLGFLSKTMDNDRFRIAMEALLPFDQLINDRLRFVDDLSPIKSMGVVVMKTEMEPAMFAFGIDMDILHLNCMTNRTTKFIVAFKTNEELRDLVRSETVTNQIEDFIIEQVIQQVESGQIQ